MAIGEIETNQDQIPPVEKSLNIHETIPTANPSVPQFLRQDLHEDQKGLEKENIQGGDVPIAQRASHNGGSTPKPQDIGKSHHFSTSCFPSLFFPFSLSLSSLLLRAEAKLQYVEHMGKNSLQQH